ncbi:MAG: Gfo/Idh/MocA family oxidoreductase [Planctomycetaceae bacterium]|nr:Gfo/Idh/MocA family oxidoreductase [Planctomycetaceae bacterium]
MKTDDFLNAEMNRRRFLGEGARNAAGVAAGVVGLQSPVRAASSSDQLRVGVIGVRSQGKRLAVESTRLPGVEVVSLCDVDKSILDRAVGEVQQRQRSRVARTSDFRQMLDDPRIDAVIIATPDHWHALMMVMACGAGKDVYVEKPIAQTIHEGKVMLAAAAKHGRIVQCGLQQRSGDHFQSAVAVVQSGQLGTVNLARAWSVQSRTSPPSPRETPVPEGVDYDLWQGPAVARPFDERRFHHYWRSTWEYGTGELGDWGVHLLDIARWGLDLELPTRVSATGGPSSQVGGNRPPETLSVQYTYPQATIVWEHRLRSRHGIEGRPTGVAFYGDKGTLVVDRSGWKVYDQSESLTADASELRRAHLQDFYDSIRTRRTPSCDLRTGHVSSALAHLGNISYRLGREVRFDPQAEDFGIDAEANALLLREYRAPWELPTV